MKRVAFPTVTEDLAPAELEMPLGGVTLRGTSVAARATAFTLPDLGVALDMGRMSPSLAAQPVVLLSHGHLDHLSGILAYLNVRVRFHAKQPPRVVAPLEVAEPLRQALAVMPGMESVRKRVRLEDVIVGVEAGDTVGVPGGSATAFALDHGVPSLGWSLCRSGIARPCLAYAADGTVEPFQADPRLLDAGVAIVECTFLEKNRRIAARMARHAHILDWIGLAPRLTCDHLVLAHLPPLGADDLLRLTSPLAEAFRGNLVLWAPRSQFR
ncbi:MAG: MBL fold metallo-hydrolase [Acidobacteriota bacterium]